MIAEIDVARNEHHAPLLREVQSGLSLERLKHLKRGVLRLNPEIDKRLNDGRVLEMRIRHAGVKLYQDPVPVQRDFLPAAVSFRQDGAASALPVSTLHGPGVIGIAFGLS